MATRRPLRYGTTLGAQPPPPVMVSASSDNDAASARQNAWNTAAAQQATAVQQQRIGNQAQGDISNIANDTNRKALANALGYTNMATAPRFDQLYAKFLTLPKSVQLGMYKNGGAPFLDDDQDSGLNLLTNASDKLDKLNQAHTDTVSDRLLKGDMGYDLVDNGQGGKTANFYTLREIDNPDPQDRLLRPKIQIKEAASPLLMHYVNSAINQGQIPDPVSGKIAESGNPPDQTPKLNTDQFQQILNSRASNQTPLDTDRFQQTLDARAAGLPTSSNPSGRPNENPDAPLNGAPAVAASLSSSVAASADPFVAAHDYLNSPAASEDANSTTDIIGNGLFGTLQGLQNVGKTIANAPIQMSNAALRLLGGQGGGQYGQIPTIAPTVNQPAVDPIIAAMRAKQAQDANEPSLLNLGGGF